MKSRPLLGPGAVVASLAASACCWLPLLLLGAGLSAAGISTVVQRFRTPFLVVAATLLVFGYYVNYFRRERCEPGSTCDRSGPRVGSVSRGMLRVSTALVLAFALFPGFASRLAGVRPGVVETATGPTDTWTIGIEGMTCAGCETAVNRTLAEVPGVVHAKASYRDASATLTVDSASPPSRQALAEAVGTAGYQLASVSAGEPKATEPALAGHWVTKLEDQDGRMIDLIVDIDLVNNRWVGEFDLPAYGVLDYPIEVRTGRDKIEIFFSAIAMSFKGAMDDDGLLTGVGESPGTGSEAITFHNSGPAQISEEFLRLEAAALDSALVEILSDDGAELKFCFNADSQKTRLLMLLSPT